MRAIYYAIMHDRPTQDYLATTNYVKGYPIVYLDETSTNVYYTGIILYLI